MPRSRLVDVSNYQQFTAINLTADPGHDRGKQVIPNGVQFQIVWQLTDGKQARNILGMNVAPGFAPTTALAEQARAALVNGSNWSGMAAFMATGTLLTAVQLRDMRAIDLPLVPSTGSSTPGTSASIALPSEVAACITLRTQFVGAGNRGRVYLPGFATNALGANDVIAAGAMSAINLFCTNISNAITAIGGTWSLLLPHRLAYVSDTIPPTNHAERPARTERVTSASMRDNHWDSQRRRGLK